MKAQEFTKKIFQSIKSNWFMPVIAHQVYSTDEQVVGVWTDGKPVYQRVVIAKMPSGDSGEVLDVSTFGYDSFINIQWKMSNATNDIIIGNTTYASINVFIRNSTNKMMAEGVPTWARGIDATFILTYTKTTDTATTSKVPFEPLHEYSTEEKLVGYWIDGKPVYQKTWNNLNLKLSNDSWTDTTITTNGISKLIDAIGHSSNGTVITSINCEMDGNYININNTSQTTLYTDSLTLQYTKTTD